MNLQRLKEKLGSLNLRKQKILLGFFVDYILCDVSDWLCLEPCYLNGKASYLLSRLGGYWMDIGSILTEGTISLLFLPHEFPAYLTKPRSRHRSERDTALNDIQIPKKRRRFRRYAARPQAIGYPCSLIARRHL
jgi:hypothetical protein